MRYIWRVVCHRSRMLDLNAGRVESGARGSHISTSQPFLGLVSSEVGVIGDSVDHQHGHPHEEVSDPLEVADAEVIVTDT